MFETSEKDLFTHSLNKTKTPKLLPGLSKNASQKSQNKQPHKRNPASVSNKYKFLFEDVEIKNQRNFLRSSVISPHGRKSTHNDLADECDLSNWNRYCNNSAMNMTTNTTNNLSKYSVDLTDKYNLNSVIGIRSSKSKALTLCDKNFKFK